MFFNSDHQMPRKQQFYQRKGERRRIPTKLQVSINIHRIQLLKFTLSIPLDHVTLSNTHILSHLYNSILTTQSFPSNWQLSFHSNQTNQLICQRQLFLVTVSCAMKWDFQYQGYTVCNNCSLLSDIPSVIYNVDALLNLLKTIDGANLCTGNPDVSYVSLAHKGTFLDQSGKQ